MKNILRVTALAFCLSPIANAVITVNGTNILGPGDGLYIVDGSNERVADGTYFWAVGTFTGSQNFGTDDAASILGEFTLISTISSVTGVSQPGLFGNSVTYNGGGSGTPAGFVGSTQYLVMGNTADILSSSLIAVFDTGNDFISGDVAGNGSSTEGINLISEVLYGITRTVAPSDGDPFSISQSVELTSIPEPSTALLGGFGALLLLRRRRAKA